jgi:ribosome-associated toxin RatA of RatAB toxin-antitoxin module
MESNMIETSIKEKARGTGLFHLSASGAEPLKRYLPAYLDLQKHHEYLFAGLAPFIAISLIVILFIAQPARSQPLRSMHEMQRLTAGEVVVRQDPPGSGEKRRVYAAARIEAPAVRIWDILIDCEHAPDFIPGLISCRYVQRNGDTDILEQRLRLSWLLPTATYSFRATYEQHRRIDFTRVSGDFREFTGSWTLQPIDDGRQTIVEYSVYLDPGLLTPQWLVRKMLRGDLVELLTALRNRVMAAPRK